MRYWKPVLIAVFIFYGSTAPADNFSKSLLSDIEHFDKLVHFCLYFALSLTLQKSMVEKNFNSFFANTLFPVLISVIYGIAIEIVQHYFTNDRHFETADIIANSAGALLSVPAFAIIKKSPLNRLL